MKFLKLFKANYYAFWHFFVSPIVEKNIELFILNNIFLKSKRKIYYLLKKVDVKSTVFTVKSVNFDCLISENNIFHR